MNSVLTIPLICNDALFVLNRELGTTLRTPIRNGRPDCDPDQLQAVVHTDTAKIEFCDSDFTRSIDDFEERFLRIPMARIATNIKAKIRGGNAVAFEVLPLPESHLAVRHVYSCIDPTGSSALGVLAYAPTRDVQMLNLSIQYRFRRISQPKPSFVDPLLKFYMESPVC